jgi:hypothetical protein
LLRKSETAVIAATAAAIVAVTALFATIGADSRWLVALGHVITTRGQVPSGIPFAAAPSGHWTNSLVLAELVFYGLDHALGDRGLMLAQLLAVGVALVALARDARAEGSDGTGTSRALLLATVGLLPALVIVRMQLFSLALFPVLCALLRADARRPSGRIWLVVPLLALWANLHGAVLLGVAVVLAYLGLSRFRRKRGVTCAVAAASCAALLLTPALLGTIGYYHGLLTNVAAEQGTGQWGPLSLTAPFDLVTIAVAGVLGVAARRAAPPAWELVVGFALAALTLHASRNGVWLLLFLVPPAACGFAHPARAWAALVPAAGLAAACLLGYAIARGPVPGGASPSLLARAIALAHGSPVLASDGIDEQVAADGGRIWAGNPIDAFSRADQTEYLDFVNGDAAGRQALRDGVRVVLVPHGSAAQRLMERTPGFAADGGDSRTSLYVRRA